MKYYIHFFTAIFILSSAGFATNEEQEVLKKFEKRGNLSMINEDQNPIQSEKLACRVPYVSDSSRFAGVDKQRDMALYQEPKGNEGFFSRLRLAFNG
ncbi:MAG: hypothetical protein BGO77_07775 [Caedibacter sp. 37-49]|nr:MAG: hypothetical protein BGO77_07775 [Caedibacter sp. 37-49]